MVWQDGSHLWTKNPNGLALWNIRKQKLITFNGINGCELTVTHNPEVIWCGANRYSFLDSKWSKATQTFRKVIQTNDGKIWAGSKEGLMQFEPSNQNWRLVAETTPHTPKPYTPDAGNGIHLSMATNDGYLWFVSSDLPFKGTTRWSETEHQTFWLDEWGHSLMIPQLETDDGTVWGGGNDGLVGRWNGDGWQTWHISFGATFPPIAEILEANDETIWVRASGRPKKF